MGAGVVAADHLVDAGADVGVPELPEARALLPPEPPGQPVEPPRPGEVEPVQVHQLPVRPVVHLAGCAVSTENIHILKGVSGTQWT